MNDDELDRVLLEKQIEVLKGASPDDWHRVADQHNWDEPLSILYWIVSQPNCDKGTARLIFWKGEPDCYDFESNDDGMGEDPYSVEPMLQYIVRRFNTDGYARDEIAFDIFQAKTGSYDSDDQNYARTIESAIAADGQKMRDRAEQQSDPLMKVPADLLVMRAPGRRVHKFDGNDRIFDTYPSGVNYDTGEFVY